MVGVVNLVCTDQLTKIERDDHDQERETEKGEGRAQTDAPAALDTSKTGMYYAASVVQYAAECELRVKG